MRLASVILLLVIFVTLSSFDYTPGVKVQLPFANDLPGIDKPSVSVAIDLTAASITPTNKSRRMI